MGFGIPSKCLMKWREPKIRGLVAPKDILISLILILVVSIPFGFLGGNGKFSISTYLLALGFMSTAAVGFLIQPLLRGTPIELREDRIVRGPCGTSREASVYKDIDCIYFYRDCAYSKDGDMLVVNVHQKGAEGAKFARFEVIMKNQKRVDGEKAFSWASSCSVERFTVPDDVNLEQVLQILRDKAANVVEPALPF